MKCLRTSDGQKRKYEKEGDKSKKKMKIDESLSVAIDSLMIHFSARARSICQTELY